MLPGYNERSLWAPVRLGWISLAHGKSKEKNPQVQNESMSKLYINCFVFRLSLTYLLFVSKTSQSPISLPVWCYPPQILIGRKEAHNPTRNYITDIGENAPGFVHLLAYSKQPSTVNCRERWDSLNSVCFHYHARRVSVLESEIQLLSGWTTAQDKWKNILRRNHMT